MFPRGGGANAMLLAIPEVQTELSITDDQKEKLTSLQQDMREKFRSSMGQFNFQDLQNLSDEERQKRFDEMRKKGEELMKGVDEKVKSILDAKQVERLNQLSLQREGAMALTRPEIAKKLHLTDDQQAKIKSIQDSARPNMRNVFNRDQSDEERQTAMKKMRDQFEKAQKDSLAVLDDDQMLDWTNMCGKTFKFPEMQFGRNRQGPPRQ